MLQKKAEMDRRNIQYNYNFLKPYIKYAKTINPTILPEAQSMLTEFWLDLKKQELATNRTLDSLFRTAKSQARLHLSDAVNEEIVKEIMIDYMQRMLQYGQIIRMIESPRDVTYREMLSIIKATKSPIGLTEAARMACQRNEQIRSYLGTRLDIKHNWGLRAVRDMLLNHASIKQVRERPLVLLWSEDKPSSSHNACNSTDNDNEISIPKVTGMRSDVSEVCEDESTKTSTSPQQRESEEERYKKANLGMDQQEEIKNPDDNSKHSASSTSLTSHTSLSQGVEGIPPNGCNSKSSPDVMSGSNTQTARELDKNGGRFRCFYCNELYSNDQERVVHIEESHPGKPYSCPQSWTRYC